MDRTEQFEAERPRLVGLAGRVLGDREADWREGGGETASVRLQLQWTPQAQFSGYFAADEQGYYEAENLTVEFVDGGP